MPLRAYGRTASRIVSYRVAPRAIAPSRRSRGTTAITSRLTAVTIGRIMIARITPAVNRSPPWALPRKRAADQRHLPERAAGTARPRWSNIGLSTNKRPQPVDDARDRGEEVDEDGERVGDPPARHLIQQQREADRDRHREDDREPRRDDRAEDERQRAERLAPATRDSIEVPTKKCRPNASNARHAASGQLPSRQREERRPARQPDHERRAAGTPRSTERATAASARRRTGSPRRRVESSPRCRARRRR